MPLAIPIDKFGLMWLYKDRYMNATHPPKNTSPGINRQSRRIFYGGQLFGRVKKPCLKFIKPCSLLIDSVDHKVCHLVRASCPRLTLRISIPFFELRYFLLLILIYVHRSLIKLRCAAAATLKASKNIYRPSKVLSNKTDRVFHYLIRHKSRVWIIWHSPLLQIDRCFAWALVRLSIESAQRPWRGVAAILQNGPWSLAEQSESPYYSKKHQGYIFTSQLNMAVPLRSGSKKVQMLSTCACAQA
ncbi:hypothetical protein BJX61DRAFT_305369 [Aspergillus egyptiacus]|nr:hypothetical protein BJX61DRAFT_305369 [Aspergillus egyptiacus]